MCMNNKGFTFVEMTFSLCVTSLSILLLVSGLKILNKYNFESYKSEDYAFIHQMRVLYALSMEPELEGDMLFFKYNNQDMYYENNNGKLILQDGYQVFLNDVEEVYFEKKDNCIYLVYQRESKRVQRSVIGCE